LDKIVIIVAGGSGNRMNSEVPKQFLLLNGYPVLMHVINVFLAYDSEIKVILVLPEKHLNNWDKLSEKYEFSKNIIVRTGGETRFHSVQKNLDIIPDNSLVAIHDGVRPLVNKQTIIRCFNEAARSGNAVPSIEISETLRKLDKSGSRLVNRNDYRIIQTPQVFKGEVLKMAYMQKYDENFTDDAGVVEALGYQINMVEGNKENIKITYPCDLDIASEWLKKNSDH